MKNKELRKELRDDMVVFNDYGHSVVAAAVYDEHYEEIVLENGKPVKYLSRRLIVGPRINNREMKDKFKAAVLVTLVSAAKILNTAIVSICETEYEADKTSTKKRISRRRQRLT